MYELKRCVLLADDEERIVRALRDLLTSNGFFVLTALSGREALEQFGRYSEQIDLVLLDVMMPEGDGFSVLREIRAASSLVPVVMLTARGEEYDKIHGFEVGADDYVVKPFSPRELMMRVNVILQRNGKKDAGVRRVTFTHQGLTIDFTARTVQVDGETVELSPKTYDLLFYLVKNRGIALTREQLISNVWGYDFFGDDRTLDTHIKLLRSSLGKYRDLIVTLRGVGYRFEA